MISSNYLIQVVCKIHFLYVHTKLLRYCDLHHINMVILNRRDDKRILLKTLTRSKSHIHGVLEILSGDNQTYAPYEFLQLFIDQNFLLNG